MELRRALLLFAIVLGIAALVSAVTRPVDHRRDRTTTAEEPVAPLTAPVPETTPSASPRPEPSDDVIVIDPKSKTAEVAAGRSATLSVAVEGPGQVAIDGLGLTAAAEPGTPARFDILVDFTGQPPCDLYPRRRRRVALHRQPQSHRRGVTAQV